MQQRKDSALMSCATVGSAAMNKELATTFNKLSADDRLMEWDENVTLAHQLCTNHFVAAKLMCYLAVTTACVMREKCPHHKFVSCSARQQVSWHKQSGEKWR